MILALQTESATTRIWLFATVTASDPIASVEWGSGRALSEQLLGRLADFCAQHATALEDLSGIVIFSGPGSFTSLRIGHTVANALADSLGIPVVGARGDDWVAQGKKRLQAAKSGQPALPHYGSEAHITKSKS